MYSTPMLEEGTRLGSNRLKILILFKGRWSLNSTLNWEETKNIIDEILKIIIIFKLRFNLNTKIIGYFLEKNELIQINH